jgi:hypothetical protein
MPSSMRPRRLLSAPLAGLLLLAGCSGEAQTREAQREIHDTVAPRVQEMVTGTIRRTRLGVAEAALRLRAGWAYEGEERVARMRPVLQTLIEAPPAGLANLAVSPITFLATVDADGTVLASSTSGEEDRMAGNDLAEIAPVLRTCLEEGIAGHALVDFPQADGTGRPHQLFATPVRRDGAVVGAVVAGIPLDRYTRALSRALRLDYPAPAVVWAALYRGDTWYLHRGFPEDLLEVLPSETARQEGLTLSPGGFTGGFSQYSSWYGYGVLPLPRLGEGVGAVLVLSL